MDKQLEKFKQQAYLLGRDFNADVESAKQCFEPMWRDVLVDLLDGAAKLKRFCQPAQSLSISHPLLAAGLRPAGEGNLYVETRKPYFQSADFISVSLAATSKNLLPQDGHGFMYPKSYWDAGKSWRYTILGKFTTGATPGNLTTEIRAQGAQPLTDAGGTILATSAAVALTINKTGITFVMNGRVFSRGGISTTTSMFAWGLFLPDQAGLILPAANTPQLIPGTLPAAVAFDTTPAGGISIQMKRSGSTAEAVVLHDLDVEAMT